MKLFARLYRQLESQADSTRQQELISSYFENIPTSDATWALYFLQNKTIKRIRSADELLKQARSQINFSDDIFEACLNMTSDKLETISLCLPISKAPIDLPLDICLEQLIEAAKLDRSNQNEYIQSLWENLSIDERYIFNRLLTNTLKSPVSELTLHRALSHLYGHVVQEVAIYLYDHRADRPTPIPTAKVLAGGVDSMLLPMPFNEANALDSVDTFQHPENYSVACEWNGVRVQLVKGLQAFHIWSRRGELLTDKFPEFFTLVETIPIGTILDGLLMAHKNDVLLPKSTVRKRIQRKRATPKVIQDMPILFCAIDLLKLNQQEVIKKSLNERQRLLEELIQKLPANQLIQLSDEITINKWEDLTVIFSEIKQLHSHALIIKEKTAPYLSNSIWHKIKGHHARVKGVLLYAKRGAGALSNQLVEFTLAARSGSTLVPFTRVPIAFTDDDNLSIRAFVKDHTIERFGPVYSLEAKLIFEISFESIEISKRHKCGFVLRKTAFVAWDKNGSMDDIVELDELVSQLEQ